MTAGRLYIKNPPAPLVITASPMPLTASNPLCRRRGRRDEYMKPNAVVSDHTPATAWLNGACVNGAFPVVVNPPVGEVNGAEPCSTANGAWPAVHMGVTTAAVVNGGSVPGDCLADGTVAPGTIGFPNSRDLAAPEKTDCEPSALKKNCRRGKKSNRNKAFTCTPPPPEENREAENVEVPPVKLGQTSYWTKPYGITTPSTAAMVNGGSVPGDGLADGTVAPGTIGLPNSRDLAAPEKTDCEPSAQKKNWRRGKKSNRNKAFTWTPPPPEENREAENVEVPPVKLGQTSYGTKPYGITTPSTAAMVNGGSVPGDGLADGTVAPGTIGFPNSRDLAAPEKTDCEPSAQKKNCRRGKKSNRNKAFTWTPPPPEENREAENVEVPPVKLGQTSYGTKPYGITTPSTAAVVNGGSVPGDGLADGTVAPGTIGLPNSRDLAAPEKTDCEPSAQKKNCRRGKKSNRNKAFTWTPPPPEENREAENVEVPPVKLGQTSYWTKPYGVTTPSTAAVVNGGSVPGDGLADGTVAPGTIGFPNSCDLAAPEKTDCETSAQKKNCKRGKKSNRNKAFIYTPPPPQEKEDWDAEIMEAPSPVQWGETSYGTKPYGPEDKLGFVPQGLELRHMAVPILPQTGDYIPAWHHPRPVVWSKLRMRSEPQQFEDGNE